MRKPHSVHTTPPAMPPNHTLAVFSFIWCPLLNFELALNAHKFTPACQFGPHFWLVEPARGRVAVSDICHLLEFPHTNYIQAAWRSAPISPRSFERRNYSHGIFQSPAPSLRVRFPAIERRFT